MIIKEKGYRGLVGIIVYYVMIMTIVLFVDSFLLDEVLTISSIFLGILILNRLYILFQGRKIQLTDKQILAREVISRTAPSQRKLTIHFDQINKLLFYHIEEHSTKEPGKHPALKVITIENRHTIVLQSLYKKDIKRFINEIKEKGIKVEHEAMLDEFNESKLTGIYITHRKAKPVLSFIVIMMFFLLHLLSTLIF